MPLFPRYHGPSLIDQVCTVDNLTKAWRRVRSNIQLTRRAHSAGPDRVTLRDFESDWPAQMARLADELRDGSYRPLPPRRVQIPKTSGGTRAIAILAIRDRIAQRAVQQVLTPLFEPLLLDCSYGCRLGVGVPEALEQVARYAAQGLEWVVDSDIASFFDTIDHGILLGLLRQRIDEPAIIHLISQWLAAGALQQEPDLDEAPVSPLMQALQRSGELVQEALTTPPATDTIDHEFGGDYSTPAALPRPGLPSGLFAALSLAQPAFELAQRLGPLVRRIGPQRLLLGGALAAGLVAAGELAHRVQTMRVQRGTPQGGPISPLLANIYLHPFDVAMMANGARMVRFVDDFVVMCPDRATAQRTLTLIERQLASLRLQLHPEKTRIVPYADGIEFLGQALAPRQGPSLFSGMTDFREAERRLRAQVERWHKPQSRTGER